LWLANRLCRARQIPASGGWGHGTKIYMNLAAIAGAYLVHGTVAKSATTTLTSHRRTIMDTIKQAGDKLEAAASANNKVEGPTTKKIEQVTSAIPSATWLVLGGGAMVGSVVLKMMGRDATANFVGQWVPTLLMFGLYNKMVKLMGSDRKSNGASARA
jgi:hypothetical protein